MNAKLYYFETKTGRGLRAVPVKSGQKKVRHTDMVQTVFSLNTPIQLIRLAEPADIAALVSAQSDTENE